MPTYTKVMGIPFLSTDMPTLVETLDDRLSRKQKTFLVTANPEIMMAAHRYPNFYHLLERADFVIPDGVGILLGSRILGQPIPHRLAGFELMLELFKLSAKKGYRIYLLGGEEAVLESAVRNAEADYPGIQIVGYQHGFVDVDDPKVIRDIQQCEPDMVFVALGAPKQESWIEKHSPSFEKGLFIGVGGSFDIISGKIKRAPEFFLRMRLEWLYRIAQRPSRIGRAMALPAFVIEILKIRFVKQKA